MLVREHWQFIRNKHTAILFKKLNKIKKLIQIVLFNNIDYNMENTLATITRPTIEFVLQKGTEIANISHPFNKTIDKGKAGKLYEKLMGIPASSACLDCENGEVKVFPKKQNKNGFVPKETIAVTMITDATLRTDTFENSRCYKKLSRTLYVPYILKNNDTEICYGTPVLIDLNEEKNKHILDTLKSDYEEIRQFLITDNTLEHGSHVGKWLQQRTKGAGRGKPKTRAFYLRTQYMQELIPLS